ncbi:unnamed protein product [Cunninghamella echinulata]
MPRWCRYCHQEGHTKFECEKSKVRVICYSCYGDGHRSSECPRKPLVQSKNLVRIINASSPSFTEETDDSDYTPPSHDDMSDICDEEYEKDGSDSDMENFEDLESGEKDNENINKKLFRLRLTFVRFG